MDLNFNKISTNKPKVVIRGPILTSSGYGVHSRQIFRFLHEKYERGEIDLYVMPCIWGNTPWILDRNEYDGLAGKAIDRAISGAEPFDISFQIQLPNEFSPLAKKNIGISACVETDKCNPAWIDCANKMDQVIVPSQHIKNVLTNTGKITTRLSVIPESFPDCFLIENELPSLPVELPSEFNFMIVSQLTSPDPKMDRKGVIASIRWLCEEFKDDHSVGIVLKTNMGRNTKIDRELTTEILKNQLPKRDFPKIHLIHGSMTDEEMCSLYHHPKVKVMVSATSGEGFGLPLLEAAAAGLPILATNWSGHLDFLNKGKFIKLDYELKEIPAGREDGNIFMKGSKWSVPSEKDFKRKARKLRESYDIPKQWASELKTKIIKEYSFNTIRKYYEAMMAEVVL